MEMKEQVLEHAETPREAHVRLLMIQAIVEYHLEAMTLREAHTTLEGILFKQLDNMPPEVLKSKYDKIFNR